MSEYYDNPLTSEPAGIEQSRIPTAHDIAVAAELTGIIQHPLARKIAEANNSTDEARQQASYMQMSGLQLAIVDQLAFANSGQLRTSQDELATNRPGHAGVSLLHAVGEFQNALNFISEAMPADRKQPISFMRLPHLQQEICRTLVADVVTHSRNGLIQPDGDTEGAVTVASRLRTLITAIVMGSDTYGINMDAVAETCAGIYGSSVAEPTIEKRVRPYAEALSRSEISRSELDRITYGLSDEQRHTLLNRTGLYHLLAHMNGTLAAINEADALPAVRKHYFDMLKIASQPDSANLPERIARLMNQPELLASGEDIQAIGEAVDLAWEIMPEGERELEERAEVIVQQHGATREEQGATVDKNRLATLAMVRQGWGVEDSYYAYGTLGTRSLARDGQGETPDQYIVLVLQEKDDAGNVIAEHAVAESPIVGRNGMYVFRQDVSAGLSWREVLALPKSYVQAMGGRMLQHRRVNSAADNKTDYERMADKATVLLRCEPEAFAVIRFSQGRVRLPKGAIPTPE